MRLREYVMIQARLRLLEICLALCLGLQAGGSLVLGQQEIGFAEKFALATDRRTALAELIPGTEEYFYYYCLHHQNWLRLKLSSNSGGPSRGIFRKLSTCQPGKCC